LAFADGIWLGSRQALHYPIAPVPPATHRPASGARTSIATAAAAGVANFELNKGRAQAFEEMANI
jgi:hypothetical protein